MNLGDLSARLLEDPLGFAQEGSCHENDEKRTNARDMLRIVKKVKKTSLVFLRFTFETNIFVQPAQWKLGHIVYQLSVTTRANATILMTMAVVRSLFYSKILHYCLLIWSNSCHRLAYPGSCFWQISWLSTWPAAFLPSA
jgi:hypothetical protein